MVDEAGGYWGATDGGAFRVLTSSNKFDVYRNVNALSAVSVHAIASDPRTGTVAFGGTAGQLDFLSSAGTWRHALDILSEQLRGINRIMFNESVLYVATDYGISTFDLNIFAFVSTCKHLGPVSSGTRARSLAIWGGNVYVGTDRGLVYAPVKNSNLADSAFWTGIPAIQNQAIPALGVTKTLIYVGTTTGLLAWDGAAMMRVGGPAGDSASSIVAIAAEGNIAYAATTTTVFQISDLTSAQVPWPAPANITSLAIDSNTGAVLVGDNTLGIIVAHGSATQTYVPNSPPANIFSSLTFDRSGNLWAASSTRNSNGNGIYRFDGTQWTNFSKASSPVALPSTVVHSISSDSVGNIWAGTFGDGLLRLRQDGGGYSVTHYTHANSPFASTTPNDAADTSFIIVGSSLTAPNTVTWFVPVLNFNSVEHPHLVAFDPRETSGNGFHAFSNPQSDYRFNFDIAIDNAGTKWISPIPQTRTGQNDPPGIMFFNEGLSLTNTSDDIWGVVGTTCGLRTNNATTVAIDRDGELWVGTTQGVSIITNPEAALTGCANLHIRSPYLSALNGTNAYITCILVDMLNNKWIGTLSNGLFVVTPDGKDQLAHFDHSNSPILDDQIIALSFNKKSGDVYIGTRNGLSVVSATGLVQAVGAVLKVGPQPYLVPSTTPMFIYGVPQDAEVHIFSVSGTLVRSYAPGDLNVLGGSGGWDGKDSRGNWASSGVYLIAYAQPDGTSQTAKFAVVRR